jgi:hypothetical protein
MHRIVKKEAMTNDSSAIRYDNGPEDVAADDLMIFSQWIEGCREPQEPLAITNGEARS